MTEIKRKKIFGLLACLFLFGFFFTTSYHFKPCEDALLSAFFDTLSTLIVYRLTVRYVFPKYYGHTRRFVNVSLLMIISLSAVYFFIDTNLLPRKLPDTDNVPPLFFHFVGKFMMVSFIFFIGISLSLIERNNRLIEKEKLLTEEKLETELKLLKAQINPHFIFNALNNIYSLTYMQSKNAPDSVLKLSEMLRYVFYDCSNDRVPLSAELKYIENFTAFQQMKSGYTQNISLQTDVEDSGFTIAPMLFIPFVENAFKYSRIEEEENARVSMLIEQKERFFQLYIENSIPAENRSIAGSGTGIKNVQHRLQIIYPRKHKLNMQNLNDKYVVNLKIEI